MPPIPYDAGLCVGIRQHRAFLGNENILTTPYMGGIYSRQDILASVEQNTKVQHHINIELSSIAELLKQGKIVAFYSGRSESGRRALGNRSILCDPRRHDARDLINQAVKHRQWFRPFAPVILQEEVGEWFEKTPESEYMSFVAPIKKDKIKAVPAISHIDGSARLQTIPRSPSKLRSLLEIFFKETGVPILLNTSFNDREPIVETPQDALKTFSNTVLNYQYFSDESIHVSK